MQIKHCIEPVHGWASKPTENGVVMESFVFPSDQARADSPELDRVCDHLEAVLEQLDSSSESDDVAAKLADAITSAAVKAGGVEPGMELSGPQLLLAVNDMAEVIVGFQRPSETLSEGKIHQVAKRYLSKPKQALFMGEIRTAIYGYNDRAARPVNECCCGEADEAWRLCPLHRDTQNSCEDKAHGG